MLYYAAPGRGKPTQSFDGLGLVTMLSKQTTIAVVLSMIMVMSAGCAGWGTDGPTNPDEETDGNGEAQTNESPGDDQETESDDSGAEEEQQGGEENSDTSASTDSAEEPSTGEDTDGTDANGPSETEDGKTADSTEETETPDGTETDSSQTDSDQGDESPSSNGGDDNGDGSPASGDNNENGDSDESDGESSNEDDTDSDDSQDDLDDSEKLTCDAFDTHEEAQSYYEEDTDARTHLDADNNGIACEALQDDTEEPETHTLTVQVNDADGNPVEGADVSVTVGDSGAPVADGTTDENGQVEFEVENGDYEIMVSDTEDAQSSANRGTQVRGEDTEYTVNLFDPDDNMHTYSATVQVVDEDGNPLTNERVEVSSPPGEEPVEYITDENGEFRIEFQNSSEDDVVQHEVVVRDTSETIHVERGEQHEQITVSTDVERQTHTLTVNSGEIYPVEGVDVTIERHADGATTTKTTDEEGQTTFNVYPGDYTVTGVDEQGQTYTEEVTVDGDESVLLPHEVPTPPEITTTITVVDQDGNPVEGVTIEAMTSLPPQGADVYIQSEPTDENGEVEVQAHAGQNYSIDRIADADGTSYQVVSVGDGMTLEVDEDGESDEIVVERPRENAQTSHAGAA